MGDESHREDTQPQGQVEGSGSLTKQILSLALPALGALVVQPVFILIDTAMVAHLGTMQLAALATASTILQTVVSLFVFLAYSTTAVTSRSLGEGDRQGALRNGINSLWLAILLGILAAGFVFISGNDLINALGTDPVVAPYASAYLHTSAPGIVGMLVIFAATGVLRGLMDMRTPLIVAAAGAVLNVVTNATLIFGLHMGIAGSSLGTALTQTIMGITLCGAVIVQARQQQVSLRPTALGIWRAVVDGIPLLIRTIALRVGLLVTLVTATSIGVQALAAHQVVSAVWMLTMFILDALAIAAQALIGYATGRGLQTYLKSLIRSLCIWGTLGGAIIGAIVACTARWIPLGFGSDPNVHTVATYALLGIVVIMPIAGLVFILDGIMIGAGQGLTLAVGATIMVFVYVPALLLFGHWVQSWNSPEGTALSVPQQGWALMFLWLIYGLVFLGIRGLVSCWKLWWCGEASIAR